MRGSKVVSLPPVSPTINRLTRLARGSEGEAEDSSSVDRQLSDYLLLPHHQGTVPASLPLRSPAPPSSGGGGGCGGGSALATPVEAHTVDSLLRSSMSSMLPSAGGVAVGAVAGGGGGGGFLMLRRGRAASCTGTSLPR